VLYGMFYLIGLGCLELCLDESSQCVCLLMNYKQHTKYCCMEDRVILPLE
jgi:hypothetical protein